MRTAGPCGDSRRHCEKCIRRRVMRVDVVNSTSDLNAAVSKAPAAPVSVRQYAFGSGSRGDGDGTGLRRFWHAGDDCGELQYVYASPENTYEVVVKRVSDGVRLAVHARVYAAGSMLLMFGNKWRGRGRGRGRGWSSQPAGPECACLPLRVAHPRGKHHRLPSRH